MNNGSASPRKAYDKIFGNFMIGNYNSQDVIDNDDGSAYFQIFNNFLVYSPNGQKADSGGHDSHACGNIYAYIFVHRGWDWWGPTCFHDFTLQLSGHNNYYYNNTCVLSNGTVANGTQPTVRVGYGKWQGCDDGGIAYNKTDFDAWTVLYNNSILLSSFALSVCDRCSPNHSSLRVGKVTARRTF